MKRVAIFPDGSSGLALILLRMSVAAHVIGIFAAGEFTAEAPTLVLAVIGAALMLGVFTRPSAVLAAAYEFPLNISRHGASLAASGFDLLPSISLALLGAGAYSIDARLFGRRVIDLTREDEER